VCSSDLTNAVHVSLEEDGTPNVDTVIKGDTVTEVLNYVQYSAEKLTDRVRKDVERAVRQGGGGGGGGGAGPNRVLACGAWT